MAVSPSLSPSLSPSSSPSNSPSKSPSSSPSSSPSTSYSPSKSPSASPSSSPSLSPSKSPSRSPSLSPSYSPSASPSPSYSPSISPSASPSESTAVVNTEYGYEITGVTGLTKIYAGTLRVKALAFLGDDDHDTCALTTQVNGVPVSCYKFKTHSTDNTPPTSYVYFGERGVPMTGLMANIDDAQSILFIFIR